MPSSGPTTEARTPSPRACKWQLTFLFLPILLSIIFLTVGEDYKSQLNPSFSSVDQSTMRPFSSLLLGLVFAAVGFSQTIDSYVASERPIAKAGVLANIGPDGSKDQGARAGVVIASPSKVDPDYVYTWTRDSSLVFKGIIDEFTLGLDTSLEGQIANFVTSQAAQQQVSNPSGTVSTGGLGEPKFNIDLSAFTGGWGRPQRDGPALRSTAFITYGNYLLAKGNTSYVTNTLWPIIQLDLDYVAQNWNQTGFDLWEEVSSSSFFTTAVQHRSLREGATFATALGKTSSATTYTTEAAKVLCFLQSYWNPTAGYITANTGGGRSGKDANAALASIHTFDAAAGCDAATFQPCSDKALSNLKVYVDSFRSIYSINSGANSTAPVATGRYPEDSYYNGNPWYLTTTVVAEQLYDALIVWKAQKKIEVTAVSLAFFQQFIPAITANTYDSTTTTYTTLISAIQNWADGFILVVAKYTPSDGSLAEQYTRAAGAPISAKDLTWSYAAMLTAFNARDGVTPASWGASGLTVPTTCQTSGGGSGGGGAGTVPVTFKVTATTVYGQNIYLTGSVDALKNWSPSDAILLSSSSYPVWSVTVNLPASTKIEYKYVRKDGSGAVTWLADPNNSLTTPASGDYTVNDTWR
ncbi:carbohydrate-binding module family 20 protein [Cylindrobasidium torrendii FP15055 ss-10]|uniref:Glucoamylase n=1 Tax=Cylindrobasidium torrendii FP15055 ss-10 TaxID=1314674 RepID=A0A0D7B0C3_9AGAR|nr:carbohydrate-binding module family 20 protein [Cylindrobasidium torrendii FP15055 ss-10]